MHIPVPGRAHFYRECAVAAINRAHAAPDARTALLFRTLAASFDRLADQADRHGAWYRDCFEELMYAPLARFDDADAGPSFRERMRRLPG